MPTLFRNFKFNIKYIQSAVQRGLKLGLVFYDIRGKFKYLANRKLFTNRYSFCAIFCNTFIVEKIRKCGKKFNCWETRQNNL